jgi:mannose-6-phosphate isomerase-like protein (cupin superfamily)
MAKEHDMVVVNIYERPADLSMFEGAWKAVSVLTLGPRESADVTATDAEVFLYILDGDATVHLDGEDVPAGAGVAVSLALRTHAVLEAGENGLRVFDARVAIEEPSGSPAA